MLSTQPTLLANDKNQTARFDTIVVLSHECPFVSGQPSAESYLEREMQVLAEHADRVIVFAHEGWFDGWPIKAGLPENVSAFGISDCATIPSESFAGRLKRLGCLAKHLGAVWSERRRITSRETLFAATSFLQLGDMKAQRMLEVIAEQKSSSQVASFSTATGSTSRSSPCKASPAALKSKVECTRSA